MAHGNSQHLYSVPLACKGQRMAGACCARVILMLCRNRATLLGLPELVLPLLSELVLRTQKICSTAFLIECLCNYIKILRV